MPSDIEVRRNYFFKPTSWKSSSWTVKNLFELKNAQRVLIEGNIFENNWMQAQVGFAVLFKSVNQDGRAPWSVTQDVTFRFNKIKNTPAALNLAARPESNPCIAARRFLIQDNVFDNLNYGQFAGNGRNIQLNGDLEDVRIVHNTCVFNGIDGGQSAIEFVGVPESRFVVLDNIFMAGAWQFGVSSGDGRGTGTAALNYHAPGYDFRRNVILNTVNQHPADNFTPSSIGTVQFALYNNGLNGNYRLLSSSPYKNGGTDGRDIGANIDAVESATAGCATGVW